MDTLTPEPPRADWKAPAGPEMNHKQLKALAKASRPWYAKKRIWALGVVGIIVIAAAAGSGGGSGGSGSTSTKQNGGVSTLSNNGKNPPQADVAMSKCSNGEYGLADVEVTITNHSSERSNYMVSVNLVDASGVKVGEGSAFSNNVEPGQVAIEKALASASGKPFATCKITDVNRFASN
jgi:hypothetical protein